MQSMRSPISTNVKYSVARVVAKMAKEIVRNISENLQKLKKHGSIELYGSRPTNYRDGEVFKIGSSHRQRPGSEIDTAF